MRMAAHAGIWPNSRPKGDRRMGANPHANGGILLRDLRMPDFHVHAVNVPAPGAVDGQDTHGAWVNSCAMSSS